MLMTGAVGPSVKGAETQIGHSTEEEVVRLGAGDAADKEGKCWRRRKEIAGQKDIGCLRNFVLVKN